MFQILNCHFEQSQNKPTILTYITKLKTTVI